jgi:hypothetical protein
VLGTRDIVPGGARLRDLFRCWSFSLGTPRRNSRFQPALPVVKPWADPYTGKMVRAPVLRALKAIRSPIALTSQPKPFQASGRPFHTTQPQATDGVYKAITEMRIRTPWIEALRKSREGSTGAPTESVEPDLTPKKMSDSFVKFVHQRYATMRGLC